MTVFIGASLLVLGFLLGWFVRYGWDLSNPDRPDDVWGDR